MEKRAFIKSYGCQMNVYDATRMADQLRAAGYSVVDDAEGADLVLLNTCHIREKAAEKVYSELGRLKNAVGASGAPTMIGVAGCVAQAEGEEIIRRQPRVDFVVGPQAYHHLPSLIAKAGEGAKPVATDLDEDKFEHLAQPTRRAVTARGVTAFLTVQEGCDKFCSFCVVPYTRGAEVSRPVDRVLTEARDLVERGVREITLLGQNVNAYHGEGPDGRDWTLARLIRELAEIDDLKRIRFTTSHPNDMEDDLIAAHGDCDKLMPYLHLPVQSGSDFILKRMNRSHTAESYIRLIERIRDARPDIMLSGDFIVGFPEETEAHFMETMQLIETVGYGSAFSFKYSTRPGTPAAERPQVDPAEADDRLQRLQALITKQQRAAQDAMVGREVGVLFEKAGRNPGQMVGKSDHLHAVHVTSDKVSTGDLARVRITASGPNSLAGELI